MLAPARPACPFTWDETTPARRSSPAQVELADPALLAAAALAFSRLADSRPLCIINQHSTLLKLKVPPVEHLTECPVSLARNVAPEDIERLPGARRRSSRLTQFASGQKNCMTRNSTFLTFLRHPNWLPMWSRCVASLT
jgi:hypothetical protein